MKVVEPVAMKTGAADADDVKDKKTEGDKKHKQRRWSEMPDDNSSSKVVAYACCLICYSRGGFNS